jgi:hypothetical protein
VTAPAPPRRRTTIEVVTETVNKELGQQGCSYCRKYRPADQVRKKRTRLGVIKWICLHCEDGRQTRKGNAP